MIQTARKGKREKPRENTKIKDDGVYSTAVYLRLSAEDKGDGDTLDGQRDIIFNFLKNKPDMAVYDIYCDNGESGTSFRRGEFRRMMEDIRGGRVNCVIVKDLSRLGREYIEAGYYIDRIFPMLGVRFIAVNDGFDNRVAAADTAVHIKNVVNAMYSRDISEKTASALRVKQKRGEFIGSHAPYGYLISPQDKHSLIIDPQTAPIVRQIFKLRAEGESLSAICRRLYRSGIMPPARYKLEKGIIKDKRFATLELWNTATISGILSNEAYIGNMVQGKSSSCIGSGRRKPGRDAWIVVKGTHAPIVSEELFYGAHKIRGRER